MKMKTYRYKILSDFEDVNGYKFEVYSVLKETLFFGFSLFGEILNREPFQDIRDAKELIESKLWVI